MTPGSGSHRHAAADGLFFSPLAARRMIVVLLAEASNGDSAVLNDSLAAKPSKSSQVLKD